MHFQSVRQKKGHIHNKTNKYRWQLFKLMYNLENLNKIAEQAMSISS